MKKILFILLFLFACVSVGGLVFYHRHSDYDFSKLLKNINPPTSFQKIKKVSSFDKIRHVFVIVEENHDWQTIYKSLDAPYINSVLLPEGAYGTNYHNVGINLSELHPSEPNYIMLESGMIAFNDHTFTTDDPPSLQNSTKSHNHLTYLLSAAGYSWKSYQEDIPGTDCPVLQTKNYAPKHDPFVFFQDVSGNPPSSHDSYCQNHIRPLSELTWDLSTNNVANYIFISPNLQDDMHDGSISQADTWLSHIVPTIIHSEAFKNGGVLFITWDESDEGNRPIGLIIQSPWVKKGYTSSAAYSHASLVKTIEEIFHLTPFLGFANDSQTRDLSDFFGAPN